MHRGRRRDDKGAAAVEFALVSFPLMLIVFGIIQFGWYFFTSNAASSAAREVARQLVVGNCWTDGPDANATLDYVDFVKRTNDTFTTTVTPGTMPAALGTIVKVKVTGDGTLLSDWFLPKGGVVTTEVEARFEDGEAGTCF